MLDLTSQAVIPLTWGIGSTLKGWNTLSDAGRYDCDLSITKKFSLTRTSVQNGLLYFPKADS